MPVDLPDGAEVQIAVVDRGDRLDDEDRARLHAAIEASSWPICVRAAVDEAVRGGRGACGTSAARGRARSRANPRHVAGRRARRRSPQKHSARAARALAPIPPVGSRSALSRRPSSRSSSSGPGSGQHRPPQRRVKVLAAHLRTGGRATAPTARVQKRRREESDRDESEGRAGPTEHRPVLVCCWLADLDEAR
jgi:hypothetical protein